MIEVIVGRKQTEAEGICSFELSREDGQPLPAFSAGSHIDVYLGEKLIRQYSLCNSVKETHRYQIAVLKEPASRGGSLHMHDVIQEGHRLQISEPRNLFPLEASAQHSLLFAGGIGITPILCMAERLSLAGAPFDLFYSVRTRSRAAFVERLHSSEFSDQVTLCFDDEQPLDAKAVLANPQPGTHLYVCGPGGYMDFILNTAREAGWPEEQLHREYFSASAEALAPGDAFEIEIASSGEVLRVEADQTVIDVLYDAGIEVPVSCEQGVCGTCVTHVLGGIPEHRDSFFTAAQRALNDQFTPCCSRAKTPRLVLNL
ncbi:Vanillate O-demethylase oxidoreductase [Pseudomonas fluorescens]|jgi:vanillate O-demethylase ferredoxin subunit|uniref:PDR/VanB family oxidoreductase n=1 Tax=Pseudomonas fluorescens TaxID=294 RepID=UPI00054B3008|nr:PDR/VanB family oxidoreductase [Pseudomonas fluorescens]KII37219.1 Vanillate O-demethylase oxidoreductase [Pseudomonas fluorescens]